MKLHWHLYRPHVAKTAISNFSAQWFLLCMGTGILAVNLQVLPYQFPGLGIISIVVWVLDLTLFAAVCGLFTARWIAFPATTYKHFSEEPEQTVYLSAIAISTSTLVEMTAIVLGKHWDGWGTVVMVLWYCDVAISITAAILPYWILFRMEHVSLDNLPPTALYPATAILSSASAGSVVITYSNISTRASLPILLLSYFLLGFGFFIGLSIIVNYTGRLLISHTPPPKKAMASFIPIAALSNAGYSASSLGRLAGPSKDLLAAYGQGYAADPVVGLAFYGTGVASGLLLLGFASYWMLLSFLVVVEDIRHAPFTLNYWSALYPFGVYALAFGQLAMDFDSPTFRTLNTIFTVLLLLQWLFCAAMTVPRVITGELVFKEVDDAKKRTESFDEARELRSDSQA